VRRLFLLAHLSDGLELFEIKVIVQVLVAEAAREENAIQVLAELQSVPDAHRARSRLARLTLIAKLFLEYY